MALSAPRHRLFLNFEGRRSALRQTMSFRRFCKRWRHPRERGGHLLPPEWLPRLERLSLGAKRRVAGTLQGKRRSCRLGSSLEFADYRVYAPGDDVRRFDWGVYSRTGKAFVRQFMDEQELTVSLFVDCSASMGAACHRHPNYLLQIRQERRKVRNGCSHVNSPQASATWHCPLTTGCRSPVTAVRLTRAFRS